MLQSEARVDQRKEKEGRKSAGTISCVRLGQRPDEFDLEEASDWQMAVEQKTESFISRDDLNII